MRDGGFTLVEMLLVVVLLGVIAGLTVPSFKKSFSGIELKNQTQDLVYLMRYAQSRSVTKRINVRLNLDMNGRKYFLTESDEENPQNYSPVKGRMGEPQALSSKLQLESKDLKIDFYPDGTIDKTQIRICLDRECNVVSTQEQRGNVHYFSVSK